MDKKEKAFLDVLKKGLWGKDSIVRMPSGCTWEEIYRISRAQAVAGVVGQAILDMPDAIKQMPEGYPEKIKSFIIKNCAIHSTFNSCLVNVVSRLREAGIEPVLLKGQGLARNWPCPELRQCGDIDLWVGEENYTKAIGILLPLSSEADKEVHETIKHASLKFGIVSVEIHKFSEIETSSPELEETYRVHSTLGLTKGTVPIDFCGTEVMTPSDDFNAFYIFSHLWHHFMAGGVGLRQVCDWMLFLHSRKGKLDIEYLHALLNKFNLKGPWQVFGCIAVDWLGLPERDFIFYSTRYRSKAAKVLKRILREGNFGHERECFRKKRSDVYILRKTGSFIYHLRRTAGMMTLFPSRAARQFLETSINGFKTVWKDFSRNI